MLENAILIRTQIPLSQNVSVNLLSLDTSVFNVDEFAIEKIIKEIIQTGNGLGSKKNINFTKNDLKGFIINDKTHHSIDMVGESFLREISTQIKNCFHTLKRKGDFNIYVLPTYHEFVKTKMKGITGLTLGDGTIIIFLYEYKASNKLFYYSLAHEYAHSVSYSYHKPVTLGDNLAMEGLAENFAEAMSSKKSLFSHNLSRKHRNEIVLEIKKFLKSKDNKLRFNLFNKGTHYPLWAGYDIGYNLVRNYIQTKGTLTWDDIFRTPLHQIIKSFPLFIKNE